MSRPEQYFDVGAALTGGWRVVHIRGHRQQAQAIFDTANDVAAAAKLCDAAILTEIADLRALCRASGVPLVELEAQR